MSTEVGMKSWFTEMLDSVNKTLVEHRTALEQLHATMEQDTYAGELQLDDLMEVRVVLDEAGAALGHAFSRLTAGNGLIDSSRHLVHPVFGSLQAQPRLVSALNHVQWAQMSLKPLNTCVRAMAVLFTGDTTRAGLVGGEVAVARDLIPGLLVHLDSVLEFIAEAIAEFN
ncbi:unnamed protein product [Alopecurus aequalis]